MNYIPIISIDAYMCVCIFVSFAPSTQIKVFIPSVEKLSEYLVKQNRKNEEEKTAEMQSDYAYHCRMKFSV